MTNDDSSDGKGLVDPQGRPLTEAKNPRPRIPLTKIVTWLTFLYVFFVRGDELMSVATRWLFGPGDVTIVEFDHAARIDQIHLLYPPEDPPRTVENDTDFVDLHFKLVNHSRQTVLVQRVEFAFEATGTVSEVPHPVSALSLSGEYTLRVPNLQPNDQAVRYVSVPHVLKPDDADAFKIVLFWPDDLAITGTYSINTRLITSGGVTELKSFEVPVLADRVRDSLPPQRL